MRLGRWARKVAGIASATVLVTLALGTTAYADPTYSVMNADGGIYWRSAPDWNTPVAIAGNGVYNGSFIAVHCYQSGTSVPGSADIMWEQATVVGGPGTGSGWVNEHFINDGQPINQPSPGVPPCNAPPPDPGPAPTPGPTPTPAPSGYTFPVYNADGGIYYRNSPHWGDTSQTVGVGVYNGNQVRLLCGASGDAVGPSGNTAWSYVTNLSRPSIGNGWVSEHYINDGLPPNQWPSGLPQCGGDIPGIGGGSDGNDPPSGGVATPDPQAGGSLYYSPFDGSTIVYKGGFLSRFTITKTVHSPADLTLDKSQWWTNGDCSGSGAIPPPQERGSPEFFGAAKNGKLITTLAGWSLGRLGPIMYLAAGGQWADQANYVLLFDPGSKSDYYDGKCDKKYKEDVIVANWLANSADRHLVVLAGALTADYDHKVNGYAHAGIQNKLFKAVRDFGVVAGRNIRKQVVVCNYPEMNHGDVWTKYRWWMNKAPITLKTCPDHAKSWNP